MTYNGLDAARGATIRDTRAACHLNQHGLAELAGISRALLSHIETGRRRISPRVLAALIHAFAGIGVLLPLPGLPEGR